MRLRCWPLLVASLFTCAPAWAGPLSDLFDRKKPNAPDHVKELLNTVQNDANAGKRARAAEELAHFDGETFPEIAPVLINVLQKDTASVVRRDAVQALGRLKPASQEALQALDQAASNDSSTLVRLQARTSRLGYHVPASQPAAKPSTSNFGPNLSAPPAPKPLPKPSSDALREPGKFLPEAMPPATTPLPRPTEEKNEESGAIFKAPK